MAKKSYDQLASRIIELVGGKENISYFTHCITRLRFNVKDKSLVKVKEIEKMDVVGCNWAGDQLQVIIGQDVADAYAEICQKNDLAGVLDSGANAKNAEQKKKFTIATLFDYIAGCIIPALPILLGTGMLTVVMLVLQYAGLLSTEGPTYKLLKMVSDAGFYFMPIFIGRSAAKKFGANEALGMLIGAMLIHPTFVNGVAAGEAFSVFGLPVYATNYTSSILPVILAVAVMAPIEKFVAKHSPTILRTFMEPLVTLIVMIPLTFCLIAPAGAFLGQYVALAIEWLSVHCAFIAVAVMAVINPFIVMTGMHGSVISFGINQFMNYGFEGIVNPANFISTMAQGASALAVSFKTKDTDIKSTAFSSATTALIGGVTEPAMYAINLKYKTPMIGAMIGSGIAGLVAGLWRVTCYVPGGQGIFMLPCYIGGEGMGNLIGCIVMVVVSVIASFAATYVLYKDPEEE